MSYIDAIHNRRKNVVHVIERIDGKRVVKDYPCEWSFYYDDPKGKNRTIFRNNVTRFTTNDYKQYQKEIAIQSNKRIWESDINIVNKTLEKNYLDAIAPKLNICYFDIEVDFSPTHGFAEVTDPFNKVTAIGLYCSWLETMICLAIPPRTLTMEEAKEEVKDIDNVYLFENEIDMLETFLEIIEDADVLTGWNSEGYDIPYLVNRVTRIMSKNDTRRFCLLDQLPKERVFENKYGNMQTSFDLHGRIHLDSMELYQQYTYHEMHSYSLDAIAEYELDERKVQYEGTLDQLYNNDFRKFVEYNIQDTMILKRLEDKLKFIDLTNELAHDNTVLLPKTLGAVGVTEQALINFAHSMDLVVPNKVKIDEDFDTRAAGAHVAYPQKGLHEYIGAIDINSLYPSAIRALNMSPETLVAQLRPTYTKKMIADYMAQGPKYTFPGAWEGVFGSLEYQYVMKKDETRQVHLDWMKGEPTVHSADEVYDLVFHGGKKWILSGNGTIFDYTHKGIVPGILEKWYAERQQLQAKKKEATDPEEKAFWDKRQLVKKINLNSLYGAILNEHCRFYVFDIGQSTTLSGRLITKHMSAFVNEAFTGEYDNAGKCVVYGDTDSVYFSGWPVLKDTPDWSKEMCIEVYNQVAEAVNESFPDFMKQAFNCPNEMGSIIEGGLELIASTGLFIKKKRYGLMIYDDEGTRRDVDGKPGKVKAMGMDLKRSDTPSYMQDFLMELLIDVLTGKGEDEVCEKILNFKREFKERPSWEKGTPKRVNNLTKYTKIYEEKKGQKGVTIPGHVSAAIHWNKLKKFYDDHYSMDILDGQKTIVCDLKDNQLGYNKVAFPIDEHKIPEWFKELPFDDEAMMKAIVDKKVGNLLNVLKWDLKHKTDVSNTFSSLFDFE